MKKLIGFILLYPFLFLFFVALPLFIYSEIANNNLDQSQILYAINDEKEKLQIGPNVVIILILTDKDTASTAWQNVEGPFTLTFSRDNTQLDVIRHELFHTKRVLETKYVSSKGIIGFILFELRYFYIEEPLAVLYQHFGLKIGI